MRNLLRPWLWLAGAGACGLLGGTPAVADEALPVAEVPHEGPVDFATEILPLLRRNCTACHNASDAESDLVLETPETILKGGYEGPGVVPGNAGESLVFRLAAHRQESFMPPADNAVGAKDFTPEELGLLKLWIDQGATGSGESGPAAIAWQPLPPGVNPIYAVAVSPQGSFVAAGRANQIAMYAVPTQREVGRLTDPELLEVGLYDKPGVAHRDAVQSLAFSPTGQQLASGGFRTVKIWRRDDNHRHAELPAAEAEIRALAISSDSRLAAVAQSDGRVRIYDLPSRTLLRSLEAPVEGLACLAFSRDASRLVGGALDGAIRIWNPADGQQLSEFSSAAGVTAIATLGGANQIITGGADGVIRLWESPTAAPDAAAGKTVQPVREMPGHTGPITAFAVFPEQPQTFVSASLDGSARLWDAATGGQTRQFAHGAPLTSVAVRSDGKRIATGAETGTAKLWNADNGEAVAELRGEGVTAEAVADLQRSIELARRHVQNATTDLDEAVKRQLAEAANVDKAALELVQAQQTAQQKAAAAVKAGADKQAAEEELTALRTELETAKAAQEAITTAAEPATDEAKAQAAQQVAAVTEKLAAAEKKVAELSPPAQKANDEQQAAQEAAETAARSVETAQQAAERTAAEIPHLREQLAEHQQAVATAEERLAQAQQELNSATSRLADLERRKAEADRQLWDLQTQLAAARDARLTAAQGFAAAQEARQAAAAHTWQTADEAQQASRAATRTKTVAEQSVAEADARLKAAMTRKEAADAALATAQEKLTKAADEPAKAVAAAEVDIATRNQTQAVAEVAEATAAVAAANQAKTAAETALAETETRSKQRQEAAAQALTTAETAYTDARHKLLAADASIGGLQAQTQTAAEIKASADAALAQLRQPVRSIAFSPDGSQLSVAGNAGRVDFYGSESGASLHQLRTPATAGLVAAAYVSGDRMLTAAQDRSLAIWSSQPHWSLQTKIGSVDSPTPLINRVTALAFSPNGELLATGGGEPSRSGELKLWNPATGELVREIPDAHSDTVFAVDFSEDGKHLATCGADRFMKVFETETGKLVKSFEGHTHHVLGVSWRADGRMLATSGADNVAKVWDFNTGEGIRTINGFKKELTGICFLGVSDNFVISTGDSQVVTRNTGGGNGPNFAGVTDFMYTVRATDDGKWIVAGGQDSVLRVWDPAGKPIAAFAPAAEN